MKKIKLIELITICSIIIIVIVVSLLNILLYKNADFWKISFSSSVTIIVALLFSFWLTNVNNNEKNRKEIYLHLLEKIQIIANEEGMYRINGESDINRILMEKRKLNNYTTILKDYSKGFDIEAEILFLEAKVQEYSSLIGNHQDDVAHLEKCEIDLKRPLELIDTKAQEIMIKIFT